MSLTYSGGGVMPLPKLAWDFNGTTTPYIGSATTSVTGSVSYSVGKYIQAVNITNSPAGTPNTGTNYITSTNYGTFNPSVGVTACFWINLNALPASGQQSIPLWMRGSAVNSAVFITLTPTYWGAAYTDGTNYYVPTSSTPLSTGVWYHLTVVVGAGTVVGYQNGVQIASPVAFSNPLDVSGFLYLGGSGNYAPTSAIYDDLRIFDRALTSAQVQAVYAAQGVPGRGDVVSRQLVDSSTSFYAPFDGSLVASGITPTVTGSAPFNANGKYGQSVILRNDTDGVTSNTLNYGSSISLSSAQGVTYAVWVKFLRVPTSGTRVNIIDDYPFYGYYLINLFGIYGFYFNFYYANPSSASGNQNGFTPVVGTWYHVAYTIGGGYVKLYFNGQFVTSQTLGAAPFSPDLTWTGPGGLGKGSTGESPSAEFDDYRLYKRELSASEIASVYNTPFPSFIKSATGGDTVQDIGGYRIHTFTTVGTSTFTPATSGNVEVLLVAGGGSGGMRHAGGGGAGGLIYNPSFSVSGAVTVTVGDGGAGLPQGTDASVPGNSGANSVFGSLTAIGGGFGNQGAGGAGGSGGGVFGTNTVGAGTAGQGNNGAFGSTGPLSTENTYAGGGGGGAGAVGTAATSVAPVIGGAGGIGLQYSVSGTPVYYAGGGGGGTTTAGGGGGAGGLGGGGAGGGSNSTVGIAGTNGTGGGGGAGGFQGGTNYASGKGGSGIVIVRYPLPVRMTGAPLFSQISQAARSSAVGAFSLRAVNATTARAVNVAPGGTFPPSAMTQTGTNSSTQTLGTGKLNGSYTASSSTSAFGWGASGAFTLQNTGLGPDIWQVSTYPSGGGTVSTPTTTTTGATNYNGEWLQFQTPFPINLISYSAGTNFLTSAVLLASTTGAASSWILVDSKSAITVGSTITNTGLNFAGYSYFRFVIITATQAYPLLGNVRFNGTVPSLAQDFYADRLGNLLTAPVTGQSLANWLGGATGYVTTWYDQSGAGQHMAQTTASLQPIISLATTPASLILSGTEYFQNTVPFTFNFGSGAFTLRYVVSNNTGGLVVYKANGNDFVWSTNEKKFWLGNGTGTETSQGGFPSQVGNSENYILAGAPAIGSTKTSVVHKATSTTAIPIYVNGVIQTLATNALTMGTDPGNFLYFGKGANASNYIGNLHEIEIFSTAFSDSDRLALEN